MYESAKSPCLGANCSLLTHILALTVLTRREAVRIALTGGAEHVRQGALSLSAEKHGGRRTLMCDSRSVSGVSDSQTADTMDSGTLATVLLTGRETAKCCKLECNMVDILKDVQNLVQESNIINVSKKCHLSTMKEQNF